MYGAIFLVSGLRLKQSVHTWFSTAITLIAICVAIVDVGHGILDTLAIVECALVRDVVIARIPILHQTASTVDATALDALCHLSASCVDTVVYTFKAAPAIASVWKCGVAISMETGIGTSAWINIRARGWWSGLASLVGDANCIVALQLCINSVGATVVLIMARRMPLLVKWGIRV